MSRVLFSNVMRDPRAYDVCPDCGGWMVFGSPRCFACTVRARRKAAVHRRRPACPRCGGPMNEHAAIACRGCITRDDHRRSTPIAPQLYSYRNAARYRPFGTPAEIRRRIEAEALLSALMGGAL